MRKTLRDSFWREARIRKSRNRRKSGGRDIGPQRCRHRARATERSREEAEARFPAEPWAECRFWAQNLSASNDLRGGVSDIARPLARKRPRQNSQDRSLIQPGSAPRIASAKRSRPSVFSNDRTSPNEAKSIACARIRASERGCRPTGSHQKNLRSSSDAMSFGRLCVDEVF